jgi:hypothetical protein
LFVSQTCPAGQALATQVATHWFEWHTSPAGQSALR